MHAGGDMSTKRLSRSALCRPWQPWTTRSSMLLHRKSWWHPCPAPQISEHGCANRCNRRSVNDLVPATSRSCELYYWQWNCIIIMHGRVIIESTGNQVCDSIIWFKIMATHWQNQLKINSTFRRHWSWILYLQSRSVQSGRYTWVGPKETHKQDNVRASWSNLFTIWSCQHVRMETKKATMHLLSFLFTRCHLI